MEKRLATPKSFAILERKKRVQRPRLSLLTARGRTALIAWLTRSLVVGSRCSSGPVVLNPLFHDFLELFHLGIAPLSGY